MNEFPFFRQGGVGIFLKSVPFAFAEGTKDHLSWKQSCLMTARINVPKWWPSQERKLLRARVLRRRLPGEAEASLGRTRVIYIETGTLGFS